MNRNRGGLRGFGQGSGGSIKDRLGGGGRAQSAGIFKGNRVGKRTGKTLSSGPGKIVASRLGLPVKGRVGGRGGGVVDAREKIILNRVSKGRIGAGRLGNRLSHGVAKTGPRLGDARARIEAKRIRTRGPGPAAAAVIDPNKLKSLKITANLASRGGPEMMPMPMARPLSLSSGHGRKPASEGIFANQMGDPRSMSYGAGGRHPMRVSVPTNSRMDDSNFLTRTVMNNNQTVRGAWPGNSASRSYNRDDDMDMDQDEMPSRIRISNNLQSRLDTRMDEAQQRHKVVVSNLQGSVTTEDIIELFGDIATPISAKMTSPGMAEVVYHRKTDCVKAIEAYHNRLLDGSPMKVVMEGGSTLKSAAGSSMKLPKASSSSVKIAPDIGAIHKVLFTSSGNSTRGLFKGGQ